MTDPNAPASSDSSPDRPPQTGLPARTALLVAAARAFGSREPDECVRNPDWLADRLMGAAERDLIREHPLGDGLGQDYGEANQNPAILGIVWLLLIRTRFIDDALRRAVQNGATQVVILGAGLDTRAYRFAELLRSCKVIEVDAAPTQEYKKRRMESVAGPAPANLTYATVDFSRDDLYPALRAAGYREAEKTFYMWEGVTMYLPERSVRRTLESIAANSLRGSWLVLDYVNSLGIEWIRSNPQGAGAIPASWGEPWIFGVPDANGKAFFEDLGFDPGVPLSMMNPESNRQYTTHGDGKRFGQEVFEKMRAQAEAKAAEHGEPQSAAETRKAIMAAGGVYWLTELTVR